jgi:hypothetical protein
MLYCPPIHEVTANAINSIRRINNNSAFLQHLNYMIYFSRLRVVRMNGKKFSGHIPQDKESAVWMLNCGDASKLLFVILNFYLGKNEAGSK